MAKYSCYAVVTGTKYLGEIEANSSEEAQEKALELEGAYVSLCHQCSSECEDPQIDEIVVEPA